MYFHYMHSLNLHISCFSLLTAIKFNQHWRKDYFPSLSQIPFNLYDNLSQTTKHDKSNLKRPRHSYLLGRHYLQVKKIETFQ